MSLPLPQNPLTGQSVGLEMEQEAIGAALISMKAARRLVSELTPEMYLYSSHVAYHRAVAGVLRAGDEVNIATVADYLRDAGELERSGGLAYVSMLASECISASGQPAAIRKVRRAYLLRKAGDALVSGLARLGEGVDAAGEPLEPEDLIQGLITDLVGLKATGQGREAVTLGQALDTETERVCAGESEPTLEFGMKVIDRISGGIAAGEVGIIAGPPGAGKTVAALQQVLHAATSWGAGVMIPLEMTEAQLVRRYLAGKTGFSFRELQRSATYDDVSGEWVPFDDAERTRVLQAAAEFNAVREQILIDRHAFTLSALVSRLWQLKAERDIRWVVLDYAQLVEDDSRRGADEKEALVRVIRTLKNRVANDMGVAVVCLSSVSRRFAEDKKERLLVMQDLYGASQLEATATNVFLVQRDPAAAPPPEGEPEKLRPIVWSIAKSRNGASGVKLPLWLDGPAFQFREREERQDERSIPPASKNAAWAREREED